MIDILIVEDNSSKLATIKKLLVDDLLLSEDFVHFAKDIKSAKRLMIKNFYDLLILDLVLPLEEGEDPSPSNGVRFLSDINTNPRLIPPIHIIGLTEFSDLKKEFDGDFTDKLWHLINYKASEINWQDKLKSVVIHLITTRTRFIQKSQTSNISNNSSNTHQDADMTGSNVSNNKYKIEKIFLSHASADKEIIDEFIDLLELIGINQEQIFYSSLPEYGITPGADFLTFIKDKISANVLVIFMLSDKFYASDVCLCEMGAAWVMSKEHIPIIIPPFKFKDISGVIPLTQGITVNNAMEVNVFAQTIASIFSIPSPTTDANWERKRNRIIERINTLVKS